MCWSVDCALCSEWHIIRSLSAAGPNRVSRRVDRNRHEASCATGTAVDAYLGITSKDNAHIKISPEPEDGDVHQNMALALNTSPERRASRQSTTQSKADGEIYGSVAAS